MLPSAKSAEIVSQAIFHGLVASLFVEALVRSWRVRDPVQRIALRLTALGYPLLVFPALLLLFPVRLDEGFQDAWALLSGGRWDELRLLGAGLAHWFAWTLSAVGIALFLMDLVPLLLALRRPRADAGALEGTRSPHSSGGEGQGEGALASDAASREAISKAMPGLAAALGIAEPPIRLLDRDVPVLFCTGVRRHSIVVSRGAIRLLDAGELRAALAHEMAHLANHDPAASWAVMAARAVMAFNPAFQVVSRAIARDAEARADERGALACGDRLALASGLIKLHRATASRAPVRRTLPLASALAEPLDRVRSYDIEVRCRRLLDGPPAKLPFGAARVALAAASLTALLFFVV